ncbi:MAG TPA: M23 family metallopeptidase [Chloroflexota bacterium]|nr:M23 family metallopeptidase [Chloroflexota bacterium]
MAETIEALIRRVAQEVGVDPTLAVAVARQESGLNPRAHNPNGEDSWGLFQGNRKGGMGTGYTPDQLMDPEFNARLMLSEMAATQKRTGLTGGALAAASQRPGDPQGYARSVNAMLTGGKGLPHTGSPFDPGGGGLPNTSSLETTAEGQYVWPTPNGKVINAFGGTQYRAPGMTGPLPESNVGLDVAAAAGSPVVAPVSGTIRYTYDAKAGRNVMDNYGYGGQVILVGDDGKEHRLNHLQRGSIVTEQGQRVRAGEHLAAVGDSGNTNDGKGGPFAHLDWEVKGPKGHENPTKLSSTWQAAGATNVAEDTAVKAYTERRDELAARIKQQRDDLARAAKLVPAYKAAKNVPDAEWLPANGVTKEEMNRLIKVNRDSEDIQKQITENENALVKVKVDLGRAETGAAKGPTGNAKPDDPKGTTRTKLHQFPDGNQYVVTEKADGAGNWATDTSKPPESYGPQKAAPAAKRNTQVVAGNLIDLNTGDVLARVPKDARTQLSGNNLIDLDTGRVLATIPEAPGAADTREVTLATARFNLQDAERKAQEAIALGPLKKQEAELSVQQAQFTYDQAKKKSEQPVDVNSPATQKFNVRRDHTTGALTQEANPNYTTPLPADAGAAYEQERTRLLAQARSERDRLLGLQQSGTLSAEQAETQWNTYQQREYAAPLSGLRAQAEVARAAAQRAQDALQRTEDQRAEGINRQREQYGFEFGEKQRATVASLIPQVRSNAYQEKFAQSINGFNNRNAAPVQFTAADFRPDPGQVPNTDALASDETARALAHISPAAAARIGQPIPEMAAIPDLNAVLGRFQLPQPA